jgi:hypothetical protein
MLNHSEIQTWVPIGKGYTNPTLEIPRRLFKKVLRARFQAGTPGQILPAAFSGLGLPAKFPMGLLPGLLSGSATAKARRRMKEAQQRRHTLNCSYE